MKKVLVLAVTLVMIISLAACGGDSDLPSGRLKVTIPDGFEEQSDVPEGISQYWLAEDGSNINMSETDSDPSVENAKEDQLLTMVKDQMEQVFGTEVEAEMVYFEGGEFLGAPGYSMSIKYSVQGVEFTQYQIMVATADGTYACTMTDMTGEYEDTFKSMVESAVIE
ncbi:MAG: hypothetical protein DBX38_05660 [Eubacteriales Family XIII. Incertae Sedis bacterium]|nr:MAG: hypothetical protein DBX38_05660 [Clostridiales Family XIII bacterium]